jgi:predicted membrane channel-forming protein YqfA (hemolysin III family)
VTQVLALGTPWFNVLIHAVGAIGVLVLLTVPALASWVDGHVMAGK